MAMYDIVVAESTSPRDGKFVEKIGTYNPNTDPSTVVLKSDRAVYWLMVGATPTDTARSVLSHEGIMYRKHLQVGVNKGAITQEQADEKFGTWKEDKLNRIAGAADTKSQTKEQTRAARLEAERKVSEARAEAIVKKNRVEEPVVEEAPADEAPTTDAAAAEATEEREVFNQVPVAAVEEAHAAESIGEMPVELTADVAVPTEAAPVEATPAVEVPIADIVPADEVAAVNATTSEEAPVAEAPAAETATEVDATPAPASEEAPAVAAATTEETPTAEVAAEETEKKDTPAAE